MSQLHKKAIHSIPFLSLPILISTALVWAFFSWVNTQAKGAPAAPPVQAHAEPAFQLTQPKLVGNPQPNPVIVANDGRTITLEFNAPEYQIVDQDRDGGVCQTVETSGLSGQRDPAQINLPSGGAMLGVPPGGDVRLTVLEARAVVIPLPDGLCPVEAPDGKESPLPLRDASREALKIVRSTGFLPASTAEIVSVSMLRSQRVALLRFNLFQYNPSTGELRYYSKIRVELRLPVFSRAAGSLDDTPTEGAFEEIYRAALLNYEQAKAWRQSPPHPARPVQPASRAGGVGLENAAPAYKIVVDQDGVYSVSYDDLLSAGAEVESTDPNHFSLTNKGSPVAIQVMSASGDDFQPGDAILFYGKKQTTKYTRENVYWLRWDGAAGARIGTVDGAPTQGFATAEGYTHTVHLEQNLKYFSADASGPELDHFYWQFAYAPKVYTFTFSTDHLAGANNQNRLKGLLRSYSGEPRHHTQFYLNNQKVGDYWWKDGEELSFSNPFPRDFLIEGSNVISMVLPLDGISSQSVLVNWFEVNYQRKHSAINDQLEFTARPGAARFQLSGFSSGEVQLLDITDLATPNWVAGGVIEGAGPPYSSTFEQNHPEPHRYLAFTPSKILSPKRIIADIPSDLHSLNNAADYILIAPAVFSQSIQTLAVYREAQGLRVVSVALQDVYDEFNDGILDPNAIHDFLAYAYHNWSPPAPMYVLLVGDGHFDFLNNLGFNLPNPVPPLLGEYDLWIGETASDSRLVAFDGAVLPSMFIGRLPVNDVAGLSNLINKIITYEQTPVDSWMKNVTFVADDPDPQAGDAFYNLSDRIADYELPIPYVGNKIYYDPTDPNGFNTAAKVKSAIKSDINSGRLMVSYVGHGSISIWGSPVLFSKTEVNALTNAGKYPFMVPMTCMDGYFINADAPSGDPSSLGETIVRAVDKGAVGSFSPTGYGLTTAHDQLERGLFRAFFEDYIDQLGPATTRAKYAMMVSSGGTYTDAVDTFTLFGDPATKMPIISNFHPDPGVRINGKKLAPEGSDTYVQYSIAFTNTGTGQAAHVVISDTLPAGLEYAGFVSSGILITQTSTTPLNFRVKNLHPNASGALTITARVQSGFSGMLVDTVEITTMGELETTLADNRAQIAIPVQYPDVAVSLLAKMNGTLFPPYNITYTVSYSNVGEETAKDVSIIGILPSAIENIQVITSGATLTQVSSTPLLYDVADLAAGEGGVITITADVSDGYYGRLGSSFEINASGDTVGQHGNNFARSLLEVLLRFAFPLVATR